MTAARTRAGTAIAALVLAALALIVALAAQWITFDHYGVSAGSSTRYCSAELVTGGGVPLPALSCQAGR